MAGYTANIQELTMQNNNFRKVLYTGLHLQLVVMSLLPGEEIGVEVHKAVDQFFRVEKGTIKVVMNGEESTLTDNMVAVVPAGTEHNVVNVGVDTAKLYTIYTPPNHPANTVHPTKVEADAAEHDH